MAARTTVSARVDEKLKRDAAGILQDAGLSVSDAIRMLFMRIADERAFPFELKRPNAITVQAMNEVERGKGERFDSAASLFKDLGI